MRVRNSDSAKTGDFYLNAARIGTDPAQLARVLGDPAALGTFVYDAMYNTMAQSPNGNWHGAARVSQIKAPAARDVLRQAAGTWPAQEQQALDGALDAIVQSMLADDGFAGRLYQTHWDNSDDTNAEGILAADLATGEVRALTFVVPP